MPATVRSPLFLQAKEAQPSVLADYCGQSVYDNQGSGSSPASTSCRPRATSSWAGNAPGVDGGAARLLRPPAPGREAVAGHRTDGSRATWSCSPALCGWTLARAHARSGDRIAIAAYLGKSDAFDQAVADFAETYADQTERDHAALADAVATGRARADSDLEAH